MSESQPGVSADEVLAVLAIMRAGGCRVWVAGGWGVDALVGRQTRSHRDLDLAIDAAEEQQVLYLLERRGYQPQTDWRPTRVELAAPGDRWVDVHPVVFDPEGGGALPGPDGTSFAYPASCFVTGEIAGVTVPCVSVAQQLVFHSGYQPRAVDLADLDLLRKLMDAAEPATR